MPLLWYNTEMADEQITQYRNIAVRPSSKKVLQRLGMRASEASEDMLAATRDAMSKVRPNGLCKYTNIQLTNEGVFVGDLVFHSEKLALYLEGCKGALLLGATAGSDVEQAIAALIKDGHSDSGVILDAAAAVAADEALSFMTGAWAGRNRNRNLHPCKRRFSPGYGDLDLKYQRYLYDVLRAEDIGIDITESYMLKPDKSVFAICGVK